MRALFLIVVLLAGCASRLPELPAWQAPEGRAHADLGRIVELSSGRDVTPEALVARLASVDLLLVGERHDNPDHHALQRWLLAALAERRAQGAVLLEMLNPEQQSRMTAVQRDLAGGQPPADLPAALAWQEGWDWSLYGELVSELAAGPAPVLAANLDPQEIRGIYRDRPALEGPRATAEPVRRQLLEHIREAHCGLLPEAQMPAMLAVQQQRDRRMAERLAKAPAPAVLLAGAYHVRRDLGVPLHLADLGSRRSVGVLVLAEVGATVDPGEADFVWFTPAVPAEDHCEALRQVR